jgi:hypothetical protein
VSLTEVAGGMRPPERREVIRLLGSMQRFEVTEQVGWRAATLMQEYRRPQRYDRVCFAVIWTRREVTWLCRAVRVLIW